MDKAEAALPVVALVRDLMFLGRINATARAVGTRLEIVRDPAGLSLAAGRLLLVDLNLPGALEAAVLWKAAYSRPVVGFASHVDHATIQRARASNLDQVIARSGFVDQLERLLKVDTFTQI